jgi:hypothetical protein
MFVIGFAAAEGSAVTTTVTAVSVHSTAAATTANGYITSSRVNSSRNATANIVFLAGICSRRTAATAASPYFISCKW